MLVNHLHTYMHTQTTESVKTSRSFKSMCRVAQLNKSIRRVLKSKDYDIIIRTPYHKRFKCFKHHEHLLHSIDTFYLEFESNVYQNDTAMYLLNCMSWSIQCNTYTKDESQRTHSGWASICVELNVEMIWFYYGLMRQSFSNAHIFITKISSTFRIIQ